MNTDHLRGQRVLVTGGTGFVGSHLLPVLVDAGARVTTLARATSDTSRLPAGVRVLRGDLSRPEGLAAALREADIVIHMAALLFGLGWQDYLRANSSAARNLAAAWKAAGDSAPRRMVLLSSLAASGPCDTAPGRDEATAGSPVSAYGWSKVLSESILRTAAGDALVTLRPPIIYGSGDLGLLPVYKGLLKGVAVLPGMGAGHRFPVSAIHADDVAQAIVLACRPEAHGIYHLSDGRVYPLADFYRAAAAALGRKPRFIRLPLWVMGLAAGLSTLAGMGLAALGRKGRAPEWNLDKFREARQCGWTGSNERIVRELGFCPSLSLEEGMRETMDGDRRRGLL